MSSVLLSAFPNIRSSQHTAQLDYEFQHCEREGTKATDTAKQSQAKADQRAAEQATLDADLAEVLRSADKNDGHVNFGLGATGLADILQHQVSPKQTQADQLVRVMSVHRGRISVSGEGFEDSIASGVLGQRRAEDRPTIGD